MDLSQSANADRHRSGERSAQTTQFLTFTLLTEEYGVEILRVQEIKGYTPITPIPNSPPFMKGVMNLRGTVVPVIGLRECFGMPASEYGKFSVIVVVVVGARVVGLLVDAVSEVVDLPVTGVDLAPELGARVDTSMVKGMGRHEDRFIILLDVDRIVSGIDASTDLAAGASGSGESSGAAASNMDHRDS